MIHFIIGEDNRFINKQILETIDKVMFTEKTEYKKHPYWDYNSKFIEIIKRNIPNKIYILDIETPSNTGLEMARKIREKDIDSIIIFLTAYKDEYKETVLENEFMFFAFISKQDDYQTILTEKILLITDYTTFKISKSMTEIESLLSNDFIKTHKSCIINKDRIIKIDMREKKIYFDNHEAIDLLSRNFKKNVKKELLACS